MESPQNNTPCLPNETKILTFSVSYPIKNQASQPNSHNKYQTMSINISKSKYQETGFEGIVERVVSRAFQPRCASISRSEWENEFNCELKNEIDLQDYVENKQI
jgi:hypothetical protein